MSQLAPAGQAGWICSICKSRLSLNKLSVATRRRYPLPKKLHTDSNPRPFALSPNNRQDNAQNTNAAKDPWPSGLIRYTYLDDALKRPSKIPLGVEALGQPAEVLVIPEEKVKKRNPDVGSLRPLGPKQPIPTGLKKSSAALLDDVRNEQGIIDLDQACANIDRLRDAFLERRQRWSTTNLSAEELSGLLSDLTEGFNKTQLVAYLRTRTKDQTADLEALNLHDDYSSALFARSAWTPDITSLEQAQATPLEVVNSVLPQTRSKIPAQTYSGKISTTDQPKHWHAKKIMRDCWGMHEGQGDKIGELFLRLQTTHLQLLLSHASAPLKKISTEYAAKLEVSRTKSLIRVECDFTAAEEVVRMIIHTLKSIRSSVVHVDAPEAKSPANEFLEEVQRLTNTMIVSPQNNQRNGQTINPDKYTVYYLGPGKDDLEDAQRLLNVQTNGSLNRQPSRTIIQTPIPSSMLIIPVDFGSGIPLVARDVSLARLAQPNTRQSKAAIEIDRPKPLSQSVEIVGQVADFFRGPDDKAITTKLRKDPYHYWSKKAIPWSRVVLGQVAFSLDEARKIEARMKKVTSNIADPDITQTHSPVVQRTFATTVPRITRVLETSELSLAPTETLVVRMVPVPSSDLPLAALDFVPQLELLINLDGQKQTSSFGSARLVLAHDELDLLLPCHSTDVRFVKQIYVYSNDKQMNPCLTDFVKASNFNIWGSERLRTPSDLRISVPVGSIARSAKDGLENIKGVRLVDYKFASLEHRSSLDLPPMGPSRPQYTVIEAGRLGGRREELAMEGGPSFAVPRKARGNKDKSQRIESEHRAMGLLEAASSMIRSLEKSRTNRSFHDLDQ